MCVYGIRLTDDFPPLPLPISLNSTDTIIGKNGKKVWGRKQKRSQGSLVLMSPRFLVVPKCLRSKLGIFQRKRHGRITLDCKSKLSLQTLVRQIITIIMILDPNNSWSCTSRRGRPRYFCSKKYNFRATLRIGFRRGKSWFRIRSKCLQEPLCYPLCAFCGRKCGKELLPHVIIIVTFLPPCYHQPPCQRPTRHGLRVTHTIIAT